MGNTIDNCIGLSNILRNNNIPNIVYFEEGKLKTKFAYASKLNIPYAILIGEDEVANNNYTLKNLYEFKQEQFTLDELIKKLT